MARKRAPQRVYSLSDVMRLTGAKRPQVEYWVRKAIICGEFEGGTGLPRQFVFRNLVEATIALELAALGVNTETADRVASQLRYGDVDADIRTPAFVGNSAPHRRRMPLSKRQQNAAWGLDDNDPTPLEDRCCAELNDDGTLKLLKLLRAYVDAGVSDAEIRKGLLAVAREHNREHRRWVQDSAALDRRWRAFKKPSTRPRTGDFWIVCEAPEHSDGAERWLNLCLTDNREKDRHEILANAVIIISLRTILEKLEKATDDRWRATPEEQVYRPAEAVMPPSILVAKAFREYEKTEERRERAEVDARVKGEQADAGQ